ncbi:putative Zn-dependent peptidase [Hyella patelloides LEGE 07179]|uniref:Putative Zn-dependent peptidase n=1 Tax=Hyella patelloides LEGE 07179 TaxID=945734 RepID=A0A563W063_9CYAN|nr:pitrilysin family protein [Hyella patelloides]VEP17025.1 putative Zn-dependent peptidase [Hyella patelloides LEGE 07179]
MTLNLAEKSQLNAPTIQRLPNGLTIIAEQIPVDAINLNVWLNVGSAKETDDINGMAHFLEHMVFKGTSNLGIGEFEQLIEEKGAVTNAATSQDYTHYYITTAPKDFAELAPLQLDVVLNPSLENEAFEREKLVVLEEIRRSEDNPRRRTFYQAMETCFASLPYRRRVLGPTEVITNLKSQQMKDFHGSWYQPESMTAAVVGNLPVEELIEIVSNSFAQHYGSQEARLQSVAPQYNLETPFTEVVRQELTDDTLQQARMVMMWRVPGMVDLAETYPFDILAVILGQGKVSRLFRDLREERGLVTQIGVSNMTQTQQGVFYISAQLPTENIAEVEKAITDHIRTIQNELIAEKDINRIRKQVANRFIFANEKPSSRANLYGYYYSQLQDLAPALNYPEHIQSITAKDLRTAAQKYLNPDAYGIVVMKPGQ